MSGRLRTWQEETHGARFELLRHFLARFFDSEMVATPGEWLKVAVGAAGMLLSAGILVLKLYGLRYTLDLYEQSACSSPGELYRQWVRGDMLSFVGVAMAATALLTMLVWQSLFPSARDCLALAGLPISARQIFQAKFGALLLLFAAFVLALNAPPAIAFAAVTAGQWQENPSGLANMAANFSATAGACVFVFFGLLALRGMLLNLLPGSAFARVSPAVQATLFIAALGALPLLRYQPAAASWWPPVWFLRLWESMVTGQASAQSALWAMTLPAAVGVAAYLVSYHRYRRLLLEVPREAGAGSGRAATWLLDRWIPDPRQQAVFAFLWKTLARTGSHRLILLAYVGLAVGWITTGAFDSARPSLRHQGLYGLLAVLTPLALSMLVTVGIRYVFSLPVALGANWVFRSLDREGRAAWLRAVERFVLWCGIAPVFAASLLPAIAILGWVRAGAAAALSLLAALIWFEALFREWRKLPFACSYVPGKKPLLVTVLRYALAIPLLAPVGKLILYSSRDAAAFAALCTFEFVVWWRLRAGRRKAWAVCTLLYEEAPEAPFVALDLPPGPETASRAVTREAPQGAPLFSSTLVASRGLLPRAWAEEIEEERSNPARLAETFLEDVRFGYRLIRRNPLFSAVVVLTLTLGIGINASVVTIVNGLALRPHVLGDPASFVRVYARGRLQNTPRRVSYAEYVLYRDNSRTLRQLAAWSHFPAFVGAEDPSGTVGLAVSCNFFAVEGLGRAALGRLLTSEDCLASQPPVAVISEAFWRARFAADPSTVGRVVEVNHRPLTVVGVIPDRVVRWTRTAGWTRPPSILLPFTLQAYFEQPGADIYSDGELWLSMAGRMAERYSRASVRAEVGILAQHHDRLRFRRNTEIETTDGSWMEELKLSMTAQQFVLMGLFVGASNLVLLIACANVATLLLARAAARRREMAIRLALGAPQVRLIRMLLTESLLLTAVAGAASIYLAWHAPAALFKLVAGRAADFPMPPDWHTFAYVAVAVMLTGILAGIAPALESLKVNLAGGMAQGRWSRMTGAGGWLVSAQVAMSMVLLVGAALFARAEHRTLRSDPGFQPQNVVVVPLYFPDKTTVQAAAVRVVAIAERVMGVPGVRSVAFSEGIPLFHRTTMELPPPGRADANQPVDVFTASPGFFETLGIPLLAGTEFRVGQYSSVIVSEQLAKAFWPKQDPVGKVLELPGGRMTVSGVAKDVDPLRFGGSENPALYRPWRPVRNVMSVRFGSGAESGAAAVRAAVREAEPNMLIMARVAQSWIDEMTEDLWNVVALIALLGALAMLLATAGIYGTVSFSVNQRAREMGLRVALGARRLNIAREVLVRGGKPVARGLIAGLWLSVAVAAGLRQSFVSSPVRLDTANPLLYLGAALVLAMAAAAAMIGPARRGARSDPLVALRTE